MNTNRANKKTTQLQTQTDTIQIQLYRHLGGIGLSMSLRAILKTMLRTYQLSGDLDLILTRLGRKAVFVEVIKVRVEECSLGWYSLAWVIHQHVHQQIVPGLNISTQFEGRNKKIIPFHLHCLHSRWKIESVPHWEGCLRRWGYYDPDNFKVNTVEHLEVRERGDPRPELLSWCAENSEDPKQLVNLRVTLVVEMVLLMLQSQNQLLCTVKYSKSCASPGKVASLWPSLQIWCLETRCPVDRSTWGSQAALLGPWRIQLKLNTRTIMLALGLRISHLYQSVTTSCV